MEAVSRFYSKQDDLGRKILLAATAVIALMVLFPPKVVVTQFFGEKISKSAGYQFILSSPAAADPLGIVTSGIEWGKLLIQLVIVAGAAVLLLYYAKNKRIETPAEGSL